MTDSQRPDDRELEQYLKGDSPLSRRYRDASGENSPPDLDEAILARARAEVGRKPNLNRYLAPVALAASVLLGVNLAWNLYEAEPVPDARRLEKSLDDRFAPDPAPAAPAEAPPAASPPATPEAPAPEAKRKAEAAPPAKLQESFDQEREVLASRQRAEADAARAAEQAGARAKDQAAAERQAYAELERRQAAQRNAAAGAAAPMASLSAAPEPAPMTEAQKIDRLIAHVRGLEGAVFIRNGDEHSAADAAKHMQLKREKAGDRCDTAEEFIRTCASFSSMSGEAYLIRFADGRTRTAEDVLREQLAAMR